MLSAHACVPVLLDGQRGARVPAEARRPPWERVALRRLHERVALPVVLLGVAPVVERVAALAGHAVAAPVGRVVHLAAAPAARPLVADAACFVARPALVVGVAGLGPGLLPAGAEPRPVAAPRLVPGLPGRAAALGWAVLGRVALVEYSAARWHAQRGQLAQRQAGQQRDGAHRCHAVPRRRLPTALALQGVQVWVFAQLAQALVFAPWRRGCHGVRPMPWQHLRPPRHPRLRLWPSRASRGCLPVATFPHSTLGRCCLAPPCCW